jgi:hypothetical protein
MKKVQALRPQFCKPVVSGRCGCFPCDIQVRKRHFGRHLIKLSLSAQLIFKGRKLFPLALFCRAGQKVSGSGQPESGAGRQFTIKAKEEFRLVGEQAEFVRLTCRQKFNSKILFQFGRQFKTAICFQ